MNLIEKYKSMEKNTPGSEESEDKKEQKKPIESSLFKMMESESEFDFIAIENRERIGLMYNEYLGIKK